MAMMLAHYRFRRLLSRDGDLLLRHLRRLDREALHARFDGAVGDAFLETYAFQSCRPNSLAYGAFLRGEIHGVGELKPLPSNPGRLEAEIAFSVERRAQHHGIGTKLMARLIEAAQNRGFSCLRLIIQPQNLAMRRLAQASGAKLSIAAGSNIGAIKLSPLAPRNRLSRFLRRELGHAGGIFEG
jgi:GNAT superfamily N-acetyltransferase